MKETKLAGWISFKVNRRGELNNLDRSTPLRDLIYRIIHDKCDIPEIKYFEKETELVDGRRICQIAFSMELDPSFKPWGDDKSDPPSEWMKILLVIIPHRSLSGLGVIHTDNT